MAKNISFVKHIIDPGASETCAIVDVDGDGLLDIVSGTYWYKAPNWAKYRMRDIPFENNYFDNFADFAIDLNLDGRPDIISGCWFRKQIAWYENPGVPGELWTEHIIDVPGNVETLWLVDLDGDGIPDILPNAFGPEKMAWYKIIPGNKPEFIKVEFGKEGNGHGIGYGDINCDGKIDIITPNGWYEAPNDPVNDPWIWHPEFNLGGTGVPILTFDVNGDGLPDLLWGKGHDYGLFWEEQKLNSDGTRSWIRHEIDTSWSQVHTMTLADIDGDGMDELISGKRYFAHNGSDPGEYDPCVLYWYKLDQKNMTWTRHTIDEGNKVGGGMQICVADMFGTGRLDIVAPGKGGLYLFENMG